MTGSINSSSLNYDTLNGGATGGLDVEVTWVAFDNDVANVEVTWVEFDNDTGYTYHRAVEFVDALEEVDAILTPRVPRPIRSTKCGSVEETTQCSPVELEACGASVEQVTSRHCPAPVKAPGRLSADVAYGALRQKTLTTPLTKVSTQGLLVKVRAPGALAPKADHGRVSKTTVLADILED